MNKHMHSHETSAIAKRLKKPVNKSYLQDWIYGGIDGSVTTFAGVAGAALSHHRLSF